MTNLSTSLNDIAEGEGDLTQRLDVQGRDEIAQLSTGFNKFIEKGNEDYIYYKSFMDDYGLKNKFSVATTILNNSSRRTTAQEDDFDDGLFKVFGIYDRIIIDLADHIARAHADAGQI